MPSSQNSALAIVAGVFIVLILGVWLWPKCTNGDDSRPAVQLAKEPVNLMEDKTKTEDAGKDFFSGMGFLNNMSTEQMTKAYSDNMVVETGGGILYLNGLQIQEEISRIIDDKVSVGTEFREEETPTLHFCTCPTCEG